MRFCFAVTECSPREDCRNPCRCARPCLCDTQFQTCTARLCMAVEEGDGITAQGEHHSYNRCRCLPQMNTLGHALYIPCICNYKSTNAFNMVRGLRVPHPFSILPPHAAFEGSISTSMEGGCCYARSLSRQETVPTQLCITSQHFIVALVFLLVSVC